MQRARRDDAMAVLVLPVRQQLEQLRIVELLPAAGSIAGRHIGLIDDLGAPRDASIGALAGPASPAMLGHDRVKILAEDVQPSAILSSLIDGTMQIVEQIG